MTGYTFRQWTISLHMQDAIHRYVHNKIPPGSFLTAVIKNDLRGAVRSANDDNLQNIPAFVAYFHNETPSACWGSQEKMQKWLEATPQEEAA